MNKHPGRRFNELDVDLSRDWVNARGRSDIEWRRAHQATRDAWVRVGGRRWH